MSARSVFLLLTLLFITVATSEGNVSNCYLRLSSSDSETQRANRKLIESYGARVIHEFPATGEFICWMALSQYDLLIQESAITGQQHDQSYTTSSHKTTNSIGEFCWMELQSPDPTPPPEQPQGVTICGTSQRETVERELWLSAPPPADRNISLNQMFSTNYLVGKTAICATTTADGGYLLAGNTDDYGAVGYDFYVLKVDATGAEQWSQTFEAADNQATRSIVSTDDGGFILCGLSWPSSGPGYLGGLVVKGMPWTCCVGIRGNIDGDPADQIDISDLVTLVDYMYTGGPEPPCWSEGNIDGSDSGDGVDGPEDIDISDLVYLIDYMFTDGPGPPPCP